MIIETDTFRSRYVVDKLEVEAQYKDLERVQVGTWFFGLFKKYKYQWSDWKNLEIKHDNNWPISQRISRINV